MSDQPVWPACGAQREEMESAIPSGLPPEFHEDWKFVTAPGGRANWRAALSALAAERLANECSRCAGGGKAIGSDRPFEWSGPGTYPGPCPECGGTGKETDRLKADRDRLAAQLQEREADYQDYIKQSQAGVKLRNSTIDTLRQDRDRLAGLLRERMNECECWSAWRINGYVLDDLPKEYLCKTCRRSEAACVGGT